jgi:hypothetical protein
LEYRKYDMVSNGNQAGVTPGNGKALADGIVFVIRLLYEPLSEW